MSAALEAFTAGGAMPVDVAQIERQLHALWQQGGDAVARACLFNLVVWCESETDRDRASATIGELTGRHPCRAIVLLAEPGEPSLSASLSAHCHLTAGGRQQVCCEQISVSAGGASVAQLAPTVLSLLEGDLPTVLWWRGNFLEQPEQFERLQVVANRVLFDSSAWRDAERWLPQLAERLARPTTQVYADLSWTRLTLWRKLMADCFDDAHFHPLLPRLRHALVTHNHGAGVRLRALLYAGWLATHLRWSPEDAAERVVLQECSGGDATDAGIESVELTAEGARVHLQRDCGECTASAVVTTPEWCSLPRKQALARPTELALLSQEFNHIVPHTTYERALAMAAVLEQAQA